MIITRSPLRITLGGGGTDLPSYYQKHGGFLISAAIDRYVYITVHETFVPELIVKYSEIERVNHVSAVKHPIFREALKITDAPIESLEVASFADIHAGTGLGSSGSFTTALLKALHLVQNKTIDPRTLAEQACHIEMNILKEPVGKQDQYIAACGGVTCFWFNQNNSVDVKPLSLPRPIFETLQENLLLFYTGQSRSASEILKDQDEKTKENNTEMIENLHAVKELGFLSRKALLAGDFKEFAHLLNKHWRNKRKRSKGMSSRTVDRWYSLARQVGAMGGKLIGAGGGGFLMFYAESKTKLRAAMRNEGLPEVRFKFDLEGTKAVMI